MAFRLDRIAGYGSERAAFRGGLRLALGVPVLALGASYLGFGALVRESGLGLWQGLLSSATTFALPGQVLLVELYALGATLAVMALAVGLSSTRLLPMTMSLVPQLRRPEVPRWRLYLAAHFIAVTGWAMTMRVAPRLPVEERLAFFTGFTLALWLSVILCTAIGYHLPGVLPERVTLALLFLNPLYFLLLFLSDMKERARTLALLFGAVLGPPLFLLEADWSLLFAGFLGGSAAFLLGGRRR
jgi:predicted branched-subunit amino acid permease